MSTLVVDQPAEGVTRITLHRPERLNAMNATLVGELHDELGSIARDQVLSGRRPDGCGPRVLRGHRSLRVRKCAECATGAAGWRTRSPRRPTSRRWCRGCAALPQPVIAAVNGAAAGGGLALALASDVRIAGASARFNVAFVRLGISGCDIGVSWLLPRLIGASRAWELMLTGRIIDAEEADRIGLVLRVVPDEELMEAALDTAALIAANSPWGIRMTKEVMWSQLEVGSLQAGIDLENRTQVLSSMTGDMQEAVAAFLEKRPPRYGTGAAHREGLTETPRDSTRVRPPTRPGLATLEQLMGATDHSTRRTGASRWAVASVALVAAALCRVLSGGPNPARPRRIPPQSVQPAPNYTDVCAPLGGDTTSTCLRVTLDAIDTARQKEGVGPMALPANFAQLSVPEQLFVAIDAERVDRGLAPFPGLSAALDGDAQEGGRAAPSSPPGWAADYSEVNQEWIGAVDNGLDADYQWMYFDGPDSGVPQCSGAQTSGCWVDRQIVLNRFGSGHLVMGAGYDPSGDTTPAIEADRHWRQRWPWRRRRRPTPTRTPGSRRCRPWRRGRSSRSAPSRRPSRTPGSPIRPPTSNRLPTTRGSARRAGWTIRPPASTPCWRRSTTPMRSKASDPWCCRPTTATSACPTSCSSPSTSNGSTAAWRRSSGSPPPSTRNAQRGADDANDPPDPGRAYALDDAEWAGGSSNGLDAVYGWMYDDGYDSGNLDCVRRDASGCWGHRKGILDDFGSGANLVMGAAVDTSGDTHSGDNGGTSMAVTLAVAVAPVHTFTYRWSQVVATLPASGLPA